MPDIKLITENLADELIPGIERASGIYILTSFVMESGIRLLRPYLKAAANRGAEIKVLAGDYLFVTQPEALRMLISIDNRIEARLWRSSGTSFHPKAYLFDYNHGQGKMIVGSSNLSLSAFRLGYEWSLSVNAEAEPFTFQEAIHKFSISFLHEKSCPLNDMTVNQYEENYLSQHRKYPELARIITEQETEELTTIAKSTLDTTSPAPRVGSNPAIQPRPAQLEALDAIHATWEEGYDRAMVVMATGLGKTYLAGFFAQSFQRVLFIAHREEILIQALKSFRSIMPTRSCGLYNGTEKDAQSELIFASIYTLSMKKHRERFSPDAFDLIVVDEFHHAAAYSYRSVLDYFRPSFLLGVTATPDRTDGQDVYALCEGNVAYKLHFIEAITRGWLSPFQYYGIYDDIDYSQIKWLGTHYDDEELLIAQLRENRAMTIFNRWSKHKQSRTFGFCSSIRHADFLSNFFRKQGARTLSLHSRTTEMTRQDAIQALENGDLDIIFTVDLFNEGVDIPSVDTLLFVRPTESLTVFSQQLGRGLRLATGKTHCVIIDLIGNYRNADLKVGLLQTDADREDLRRNRRSLLAITAAPPGCAIDLEIGVIDLLKELSLKKQPYREQLRSHYLELKQELGRRPTYLELHLRGKAPRRAYKQEFKAYVGFLWWAGELSEMEQALFSKAEGWLQEVEGTSMNKSYKMVLLLAMLERGPASWRNPITARESAPFFHRFLIEKEYRRNADLADKKNRNLAHVYNESQVASLIAQMPMKKWSGSSKGYVSFDEEVFAINQETVSDSMQLYEWTREICLYRLHEYFERKTKGEGDESATFPV